MVAAIIRHGKQKQNSEDEINMRNFIQAVVYFPLAVIRKVFTKYYE